MTRDDAVLRCQEFTRRRYGYVLPPAFVFAVSTDTLRLIQSDDRFTNLVDAVNAEDIERILGKWIVSFPQCWEKATATPCLSFAVDPETGDVREI
jgi:hypothetical protein